VLYQSNDTIPPLACRASPINKRSGHCSVQLGARVVNAADKARECGNVSVVQIGRSSTDRVVPLGSARSFFQFDEHADVLLLRRIVDGDVHRLTRRGVQFETIRHSESSQAGLHGTAGAVGDESYILISLYSVPFYLCLCLYSQRPET